MVEYASDAGAAVSGDGLRRFFPSEAYGDRGGHTEILSNLSNEKTA
jgi:hypothetical protein